jgi:SAM-dependent methyltransferase
MIHKHALLVDSTAEEKAHQAFASSLRIFVLNDVAADMRASYEHSARHEYAKRLGHLPRNAEEIHNAMWEDPVFKVYSVLRHQAQQLTWSSVIPTIDRHAADFPKLAAETEKTKAAEVGGSLTLNPNLEVPKSVSAIDVHLMPGNYHTDRGPEDLLQGALYDHGVGVFAMGLWGPKNDDIGQSIARWLKAKYPDFKPKKILDLGCTIGCNTLPWKEIYPDAEVHAIDVAAPCLRWAYARGLALGQAVHWHQMDATKLDFADESFDLVWSSMFFHEVPLKGIKQVLKEAHRVTKQGGLMLHYELPPNKLTDPYDGFYLDWDSYYNAEPFYKTFRDQDPEALCAEAGFPKAGFIQAVVPSLTSYGEKDFNAQIRGDGGVDAHTGRFAKHVKWFTFGNWKGAAPNKIEQPSGGVKTGSMLPS